MKLPGKPQPRVRILVSDPGQPLPDLRETAFLKAASKNRKRIVHNHECCIGD
jgi:hypothetical protein